MKENNFISAVIYIHNNEKQISEFLKKTHSVLEENFKHYEIICVDDYCMDGSVDCIRKFANTINQSVISIIHMSYYQGRELSMNAGIDLAIGDFVLEFDTVMMDYEPDLVMQVYFKSLEGFDVVNAVPKGKCKKSSKLFYAIFNRFSNPQYILTTESFRITSRRVINRVHAASKTIPYRKALYSKSGLKQARIDYKPVVSLCERDTTESKKVKKELAMDSIILFTDVAYRFSIVMSVLMMLSTILVGVYTMVIFLSGTPQAGWTTTMFFLSFCFFGVFVVLSIMLKYLSLIVNLIFKKSKYIFESIEKISK
ncbi:MAG: glycosyltransferase [Bacillota bacterium]|nr:glycosyltransferase [Bacillota bacterium]